jgi:ribonuclease P protein component
VQRLKTRAQFQAVMAGSTVARTAHFALHRVPLDAPVSSTGSESARTQALFVVHDDPSRNSPYVGVVLPKRWAKRAVTRNAIKRQVYAVSDALNPPLPAAAHVVRLRAGFDRAQFLSATSPELKVAVRSELNKLFARASA